MIVFSGEAAFATADGGATKPATFDFDPDGAAAGAMLRCGAEAAIRATEGGAVGAARGVKGSPRRRGAGLAVAGATTALGRAGTTLGCAGEKLGWGGATSGTDIAGIAKTGSSKGRWNVSGICAARLASR